MLTRIFFPISFLAFTACDGQSPQSRDGLDDGSNAKSTRDVDGDGYSEATGDCDEASAYIHPGATELCDEVDNDCDGDTDDADTVHVDNIWALDDDGDGFNSGTGIAMACDVTSLEEFVEANGGTLSEGYEQLGADDYEDADGDGDVDDVIWDCNDQSADVYPGASEVCDGMANDCDSADTWSEVDEEAMMIAVYADTDGDFYGDASNSTSACGESDGWVEDDNDCNDDDSAINPDATEVCDEADNDCDTAVDEGVLDTFYADNDADGQGDGAVFYDACEAGPGYVDNADDCNDGDATIYDGATETCADDGTDNDCDGDSGDTPVDETTHYDDVDADGYGDPSASFTSCIAPGGYVDDNTDCNDLDPDVHPGAGDDGSDGIDNDCDGMIDEDPCAFVVRTLATNGDATSITSIVEDDALLSGEWYPAGVPDVTVTATHLGGSAWQFYSMMDLCSGSVIYDINFADGTSLGDGASQSTKAWKDGTVLTIDTFDNGDGTFAYEIVL